MESFVHLRKGRTPRRLYADLEGLKDDELGRGGFTGQWSYDDALGDGVACGSDIVIPALVIGNLADDTCPPSHTRRLFETIGHPDREMHEISGATHYYAGPDQRDKLRQAVDIVTDWLVRHDFASAE